MKSKSIACALSLQAISLWLSMPALAAAVNPQPLAPTRYQTAEGIEVIVGRDAAASSAVSTSAAALAIKTPPSGLIRQAALQPSDAQRSIAPEEQLERDKERMKILNQELLNEGRALEVSKQALRSSRASTDLTTDQIAVLHLSIERREANVRALNDEIRRASAQVNIKPPMGQRPVRSHRTTATGIQAN